MKFEIKSRVTGSVLFSLETDSLKLCVEAAVKSGTDLSDADLPRANLSRADLSRANLSRADLYGADLYGANLAGTDLSDAALSSADLSDADLSGTNLSDADLSSTNLAGTDLSRAYLIGTDGTKITLVGDRPCLQLGPLGSRCAYLLAFMTDAGIYIRAGCFWGTLEQFRSAVQETHGTSVHGKEYAAAIGLIKSHAKLWAPEEG